MNRLRFTFRTRKSAASPMRIRAEPMPLAEVGDSLLSGVTRRRAVGRIGGIVGACEPASRERLRRALGDDARILAGPKIAADMVADWDCCSLADKCLRSLGDWHDAVEAGRLEEVHGAFAIAWRTADGRLTLARDAIGERTLYYAQTSGGLIFASSIRALLATGLVARMLSLPAVAAYLTYAYLPGRETLVDDVYELLPGEILEYHRGEITRRHYWTVPDQPRLPASEADLRDQLSQRLIEAVRSRLPTGEPVGASLSGGLDSSLVVALACKLHTEPVHTYSISFGAGYANELPYSSLVAEHCRTRHRIVEISPASVLRHLDETIGLLSDPIGDPLTVPNALLFRVAAADVGVLLNGEGGDPCFGGPKNLPMLLGELYGTGGQQDQPYARAQNYLRAHLKCFDDLPYMLADEALAALVDAPLEEQVVGRIAQASSPAFVGKLQALNVTLKGGHHILPKVDALSRPFGVASRAPLFDRRVVELSFAIPPQLKLRGSVEKYLLKEVARELLPATIVDRPKSGMLVPVEGWFQGPLADAARERILDGLAPRGLFRQAYLERLLDGRLGGLRPRHGAKIWLLLTLEAWLRGVLFDPNAPNE